MTDYTLTADAGSYAITGSDADLLLKYSLAAGAGSYAITGTSATLTRDRVLSAGSGSYVVTGTDVTLTANFIDFAEMHNFLEPKTAGYTATNFDVTPQTILLEIGEKKSKIYRGHGTGSQRLVYTSKSTFEVELQWDLLTEADAGAIFDFYHDQDKACGMLRTFQWAHPTDGYTYVVRFIGDISRNIIPSNHHGIAKLRLAVDGYVA